MSSKTKLIPVPGSGMVPERDIDKMPILTPATWAWISAA